MTGLGDRVRRNGWRLDRLKRHSFLSQCLTIAANSSEPGYTLVSALRAVPSPSRYRLLLSRYSALLFPVAALLLSMWMSRYVVENGRISRTRLLMAYVLSAPLYVFMIARMRTRWTYTYILGAQSGSFALSRLKRGRLTRLCVPRRLRRAAVHFLEARASITPSEDAS